MLKKPMAKKKKYKSEADRRVEAEGWTVVVMFGLAIVLAVCGLVMHIPFYKSHSILNDGDSCIELGVD